jgi:hypothetical protein
MLCVGALLVPMFHVDIDSASPPRVYISSSSPLLAPMLCVGALLVPMFHVDIDSASPPRVYISSSSPLLAPMLSDCERKSYKEGLDE